MSKAYPNYKPSGVEWLGDVPEHWVLNRSRYMLSMNPSKQEANHLDLETELAFLPMEAVGDDGSLRLDATRPISEVCTGYTFFAEGDVAFAKITPCFENGKGAIMRGLGTGYGFGTTELTVMRPGKDLDAEYLYYLSISDEFRKNGEAWMYGAGGQKRVPDDYVKDFRFCFPPLPEQQAIAEYLDGETGRIDALIGKNERLLELQAEQRSALISRAVTKGLDATVTMKPSGVEWLGDVPEHWEVKAIKYLFENLDYKRIPIAAEDRSGIDKIYPYYGASGIIDYVEDYIYDETLILVAEDGANLLSRSTVLAFRAEGKYWVNNHAHILRPKYDVITYWESVLQIFDYTPYVSGSAQPKLTADNLGSFLLPLPPLPEQQAIAEYLDSETSRIDALSATVKTVIEKLKEFRTALISAAVTGKIDVREAV